MVTMDNFHKMVGKVIMVCQIIELDVKMMYSGMMEGSFNKNLKFVRNKPLGNVLIELENIDNSDNNPYFTKSDYDLLFEIKDIRNYWVHQGYSSFMYLDDQSFQMGLENQFDKIQQIYLKLSAFSKQVEKIRLDVMKKFGRIK